ncbi:MAG: adenylate/guanylate cyclase domain-containing protein, partial [Acidimicrobiia bacterium]
MLPSGTVTLLFTDIEGSSKLWDARPEEMRSALATHNEIVAGSITAHNGSIVKDKGDGFFAAFERVPEAVAASLDAQRQLEAASWDQNIGALKVRMALHTGTLEPQEDDYHGPDVNRVARLEAVGHGGQVLVSDATRALAQDILPEGVELRDLGFHHLRSLARPERVYQLVTAELSTDFPPLRSAPGAGAALPDFPTSFVGRETEVSEISELLVGSELRLLTLLGPGGIGKTRLAVETARKVSTEFPGGTYFIDLAPISDPTDVPMSIAQGVGAHAEGAGQVLALVTSLIAVPTLLLVDNFEHVAEAGTDVADLIAECPELTFLVTSRTPLRIRGENTRRIDPLAVTGNGHDPAAVQLFVDRAAEHGVDLDMSGPQGASIQSICARLDGLPLAIELVASRVRVLDVAELDRRLADSLSILGSGASDLPERQRTIQATIDWSLEALGEAEQAVFRRLAALPAGATLDTAEAVCGFELEGDMLDALSDLVDNSLVNVTSGLAGGNRFSELKVLREYGTERLRDAGELDETMSHLVDHYVTALPALGLRMDEEEAPLRELQAEFPNLTLAMDWCLGNNRTEDMVNALYDVWVFLFDGDVVAGVADWLARADSIVDSPEMDWLTGMVAFQAGEMEVAADRLSTALDRFSAEGDDDGVALSQLFLGNVTEDPADGLAMQDSALKRFRERGRNIAAYAAQIFQSVNLVRSGALEEALDLRQQLVALAVAAPFPELRAWTHWVLALVLFNLDRFEEAVEHNRQVLDVAVELRSQEMIASSADLVAVAEAAQGRLEEATLIHGACQQIWERLGV